MKNLKFLQAILLSLLLFAPTLANAGHLISIIVADTTDDSIGTSVQKDFANVQKQMSEIAKYTKMPETKIHLRGKNADSALLKRSLSDLVIKTNDVVIFFFAGHGFHPRSQKTPWPSMHFPYGTNLPYGDIIKLLEKKKPRLLITIADTCNSYSRSLDDIDETRASITKASEYVLEHNYKQLFLETTGTIKVTSSSVGEFAWGGRNGGVFTNAFLLKLNEALQSRNGIDWEVILEKSYKKTSLDTSKNRSTQHPYYEINVRS